MAEATELISIIVPVYNAEKFLKETMDCVRRQTYSDWELLLVDDGSSDGSERLIENYIGTTKENRIFFIRQPRNMGAAMARNRGVSEARGRYITFLDADDLWVPIGTTKENRIFFIRQPRNMGAAMARNRGVSEARGRYITFLDADDLWVPEKLEKELAFLQEKKAAFVFTGYEFADEQGKGTGKIVRVPETLKSWRKSLHFCRKKRRRLYLPAMNLQTNRERVRAKLSGCRKP